MTPVECRKCHRLVVPKGVYGGVQFYGALVPSPHCYHKPITRRGDDRPGVVASAGRRTET